MDTAEKHLKNNVIIRHTQHRFIKGESCLTNLISFYDKATHLVDEEKLVDVPFFYFSEVFDTATHSILLDKLSGCGINTFMVLCVKPGYIMCLGNTYS